MYEFIYPNSSNTSLKVTVRYVLCVNDFHTSAVHHKSGAGIKSFNVFRVRITYVHILKNKNKIQFSYYFNMFKYRYLHDIYMVKLIPFPRNLLGFLASTVSTSQSTSLTELRVLKHPEYSDILRFDDYVYSISIY